MKKKVITGMVLILYHYGNLLLVYTMASVDLEFKVLWPFYVTNGKNNNNSSKHTVLYYLN